MRTQHLKNDGVSRNERPASRARKVIKNAGVSAAVLGGLASQGFALNPGAQVRVDDRARRTSDFERVMSVPTPESMLYAAGYNPVVLATPQGQPMLALTDPSRPIRMDLVVAQEMLRMLNGNTSTPDPSLTPAQKSAVEKAYEEAKRQLDLCNHPDAGGFLAGTGRAAKWAPVPFAVFIMVGGVSFFLLKRGTDYVLSKPVETPAAGAAPPPTPRRVIPPEHQQYAQHFYVDQDGYPPVAAQPNIGFARRAWRAVAGDPQPKVKTRHLGAVRWVVSVGMAAAGATAAAWAGGVWTGDLFYNAGKNHHYEACKAEQQAKLNTQLEEAKAAAEAAAKASPTGDQGYRP